jgi:membrane-associated phospholipid phosphatase
MWFVGGSSFPSGHTAFYFGLFLPLAWLFPRHHTAWMFVPVFIALARINANDHYLADVCTSIVLCCLLTLAFARLLRPWLPRDADAS